MQSFLIRSKDSIAAVLDQEGFETTVGLTQRKFVERP